MVTNHIDHIALVVKNMEESLTFYTENFGFKLQSREDIPGLGMQNAIMQLDGDKCILELVHFTDGRAYNFADGFFELLSINVADIAAAEKELRAKGIEFLIPEPLEIAGIGGFFTFLRGPSGEKIEIIQIPR